MEQESPTVGVFVCHCGTNIGGVVNVPSVVQYSRALDGVSYAEANTYSCSSDGLNSLKKAIKTHRLNRVVVASCTPRTHEPLFRSALEEAGLNPYLFEMANIRDQCSWVHMHEPEAATEKAKALVRMAVAKAMRLKLQNEPEIMITPVALVIGGGISGITAALSLAKQGFPVHLVEKESKLGGMLLRLNRLFPTDEDSVVFVSKKIEEATSNPMIKVHMNSQVRSLGGFLGNFQVEIEQTGSSPRILEVGTVVVATGSEVLKPVGQHGYGEDSRVVTHLEFGEALRERRLNVPQRVCFIQCVGSRTNDMPYCSRICCNEALKNALLLKRSSPDREVYILYRDLQAFGIHSSELERSARKYGVKLVKYLEKVPPQISFSEEGIALNVFTPLLGDVLTIETDLLVLSTPLVPSATAERLSKALKVPLGSDGFFLEAHVKLRPIDFASDGIYVCGTAHGPKGVSESMTQAAAAASRAAIPMGQRRVRTEAITAEVDQGRCIGCGICIGVCPYNAIEKAHGVARVTSSVCKGCGVCGATCPVKAIAMNQYTDEQLLSQGRAAFMEVSE